jgi:shikimate 5-dehydrogenase
MKTSHKNLSDQDEGYRGFTTLLLVLITGTVGSAIAISLVLSGLGYSRSSLVINQSDEAKALADSCAEKALEDIRENLTSSGTVNLSLGQGACSYTITPGIGEARTIDATGTSGTVVRNTRVVIDAIKPKINTVSWQETT